MYIYICIHVESININSGQKNVHCQAMHKLGSSHIGNEGFGHPSAKPRRSKTKPALKYHVVGYSDIYYHMYIYYI